MKKQEKSAKQLPPETYSKNSDAAPKAATQPSGPVVLPVGKANVPFQN